jgi:hypothetical protein
MKCSPFVGCIESRDFDSLQFKVEPLLNKTNEKWKKKFLVGLVKLLEGKGSSGLLYDKIILNYFEKFPLKIK